MTLCDVNLLVYAHRPQMPDHQAAHAWLLQTLKSDQAYGISELVLASVIRLVTNPRIFAKPTPMDLALEFANDIRTPANAVQVAPGPRHWEIFSRLCRDARAKRNIVTDAYLAAMAIESGCEWITLDGDFARFDGLKWRRPF
jgi:toxin-antitoxin system PIN domain toxin